MINDSRLYNDDPCMQYATATACHAQLLVNALGIVDGKLEVSFHRGIASPLSLAAHRLLSAGNRQKAYARQSREAERICRLWAPTVDHILTTTELQHEVIAGMNQLIRYCRFSLGAYQFDFDFAFGQITARKGLIRDFVFGRRLLLKEIPGLQGLDAALRCLGEVRG